MPVSPTSQLPVVSLGWRCLQNVEKHKTWTHAILTVDSQKTKERVTRILCSKHISGVFLRCCEVGQSASEANKPRGPPPRPTPNDTGRPRRSDAPQNTQQPQVLPHPFCPCQAASLQQQRLVSDAIHILNGCSHHTALQLDTAAQHLPVQTISCKEHLTILSSHTAHPQVRCCTCTTQA